MLTALLLALAAFVVSSLGPGFLLLRKVEMAAAERLTASVALSLLLIYLSCFLIFLLRLPVAFYGSILLVSAGMLCFAGRDLVRFLADRETRRVLLGFGVVAVWALVLLSLIRNYSGDTWYGDWLEHYQRSLFFLDRPDPSIRFQGDYSLPGRPPFMNVICGYFMVIAGRQYPIYQLVSTLLSLLITLPAFLLFRRFSPKGRAGLWALAGFLMFNPMVAQNLTYSWTKLLAAFYVLAGIHFYLRGWLEEERRWTVAGFASLSCGLLSHYSAGPCTLFLAGHYLLCVFPGRRRKWAELSSIALVSFLILAGWFGYSVATFGGGTVTSTTSYFEAASLTPWQNVAKILGNIRDTLVPSLVRGVEVQPFGRGLFWGPLRDAAFKLYQFDLLFALGSLGWVVLIVALHRAWREGPPASSREKGFWFALPIVWVVVGVGVQGERYPLGLTHITLQPLAILGIVFLAARFGRLPAVARWMALAGLILDLLLGIALHFWFQASTYAERAAARGGWGLTAKDLLVGSVWANWKLKQEQNLVYLGDLLSQQAWIARGLGFATAAVVLALLAREAAGPVGIPDGPGRGAPKIPPRASPGRSGPPGGEGRRR